MKKHNNKKQHTERIVAIISLVILIAASIIGFSININDISGDVLALVPSATRYEQTDFEQCLLYNDSTENPIACVDVSKYNGFGGPMIVATVVNPKGDILNVMVIDHKETRAWYKRVMESKLIPNIIGKNYMDPFINGDDVDALTGATYTTRAITQCVKETSRKVAVTKFGLPPAKVEKQKIKFGIPELVLLVLLLVGTLGINKAPKKYKKRIRWIILLTGLGVIGFWVNHPLTLVDINKLLMGYFPDIYNQLYWYILVFGILLIFLTSNKNIYCSYVCPFGAAQECLSLVAKAKNQKRNQFSNFLKWARRIFVFAAIAMALIMRNPSVSSYEVYSTFFTLSGTNGAVLFLALVIIAALFIKRPWCNYLCPIPPIEQFARVFINWGKEFKKSE